MFALAAEMFRVMSAPTRLKIISHLCEGEKNVSELIALIKTTQPNISQHLNTLHQAGIVGRRREGVQIYYHIANDRIVALCRSLCGIVSAEAQIPHP
jgi:ArsR family transcriptional regulator